MRKTFLLEQCYRLIVANAEETEELKENNVYGEYMLLHDKGHEILLEEFVRKIKKENQYFDVKTIKTTLRKIIEQHNAIINLIDIKYNYFTRDEKATDYDNEIYFISDGTICIARTLIEILNKNTYIKKL